MNEEIVKEKKCDNWISFFKNNQLNVRTEKKVTFDEAYKEIAKMLNCNENDIEGLMKVEK